MGHTTGWEQFVAKVSGKVFISYRRTDGESVVGPVVGRLIDLLAARYGASNVVTDGDSIRANPDVSGVEFADAIRNAVRQCVAQLVIIGPQWLDAQTPDGQRRLDDPEDGVRITVETALQRGLIVIPLLVAGGQMPGAFELPPSLQPIAKLQALPLRDDPHFTGAAQSVTAAIDRAFATRPVAGGGIIERVRQRPWMLRRPLLSAVAILLVVVSLALLLSAVAQQQPQSPTGHAATATFQAAQFASTVAAQATQTAIANATLGAVAAPTQTAAAQATATASAIAEQTASAAATQTTTTKVVHFPYFTHTPGPGCDVGNAPWQGAGYTCFADHTKLASGPVAEPYLDWYRADQPNPFPTNYTLSVRASNIVGVYLVVGSASGSVYQISLQSSTPSGPVYVVEQCSSLTSGGGAGCTTPPLATSSHTTTGAHTLAITRSGTSLSFRIDDKQVATASDPSPDTAAVQVVGSADVTDFSLG
jgi:hypothetical protein